MHIHKHILIMIILLAITQQISYSQQIIIADSTNIQEIINKYINKNITIKITEGEYLDTIRIPGSITMIADDKAVIYAPVIISGDNVKITNLNIKIIPYGAERAIYILNSNNITLTKVQVEGGPIIIHNSSNVRIEDVNAKNVTFPVFDIINSTNINIINLNIEESYKLAKICNSTNIIFKINSTNTRELSLCENQDKSQIKLYNAAEEGNASTINTITQIKTSSPNTSSLNVLTNNTSTTTTGTDTSRNGRTYYIIALILALAAVILLWRKKR